MQRPLFICRRPGGFTLIELLISIGVVAVLAGIVIVAVNPSEMLRKSRDTRLVSDALQVEKAFEQHMVDAGAYPDADSLPLGESDVKPICASGIVDDACVDAATALVPTYIAALPMDYSEKCPLFSGFGVYRQNGRVKVMAYNLGRTAQEIALDVSCPSNVYPTLLASVPDDGVVGLGATTLGEDMAPVSVTVRNTGHAALELQDIAIVRNQGDFAVTFDGGPVTDGSTIIIPARSEKVLVLDMDTAAAGTIEGSVTFTTNDPSRSTSDPFAFTVGGTVYPPGAAVFTAASGSQILVSGASTVTLPDTDRRTPGAAVVISLENTGIVPLTVSSIVSSTSEVQVISSLSAIPVGGSGTFTVRLTGGTTGEHSGVVVIDTVEVANFSFSVTGAVESSLTRGLVARWAFDEVLSGTAADTSGNGLNGTHDGVAGTQNQPQPSLDVPAALTWSTRSLQFDGTDDRVGLPDSSLLNMTGAYAITGWVKTSQVGLALLYGGYSPVNPYPGYGVGLNMAGQNFAAWHGAEPWLGSNVAVNDGVWHHIAIVFDGATVAFYRDGLATGLTAVTAPMEYEGIRAIGSAANGASSYFSGWLDDLRIYNRALSALEVGDLAVGEQ